ncbi:MAG: hypothetical protein D6785_00660 [Planctomycetota bacterium]|nr:MAG: hypothetical protein D6785_00660 [Planctomycetota bacterium]
MKEKHILSLAPEIKALKEPWPSLGDEIPGLTEKLERAFRQGQGVFFTIKGYLLGGNIKGGSSCIWRKTTKDIYKIYKEWYQREGFRERISGKERERLKNFLKDHNIILLEGDRSARNADPKENIRIMIPDECYALTYEILTHLPPHHLINPYFQKLQIGGWGPDSAKGSAFHNNTVMMYDLTVHGAKRTYAAILLHEIGHAHALLLEDDQQKELYEHFSALSKTEDWIGLEYYLGSNIRKEYQKNHFNEFLAETYLHYVVIGKDLPRFLEGMAPASMEHWKAVFQIFQNSFDDWEYL